MRKILLLGCTGKIGAAVLEILYRQGFEYNIALALQSPNDYNNIYKLKSFKADITNKNSLKEPIFWADIVINCSGYVSYRPGDRNKLYAANIKGINNLVYVCEKFRKTLIHTSSAVAYGSSPEPVRFSEKDYNISNVYRSYYSQSKLQADIIIQKSALPSYIILRPGSTVSGKKCTLRMLYKFFKKGLEPGFKGGASFVLMKDIAYAYALAVKFVVKNPECREIFNLGGHNITIREIFARFREINSRKTILIPRSAMFALSIFSDYILTPLFGKSLLTYQNFKTAGCFTWIDSSKAKKILGYKISRFSALIHQISY